MTDVTAHKSPASHADQPTVISEDMMEHWETMLENGELFREGRTTLYPENWPKNMPMPEQWQRFLSEHPQWVHRG
ncbi:hypothetical protein [Bifidobacterium simiarum]|uniref:Uncharacterized protein n=1 Tax=Bifidobacterium simiarum TaxID=2045441 RepID=A0A2M9HF67_9BIFI|nr:hypothetical protein [Bifidobacterium simiarum]MBT1165501.1 hypothetical protein [Bifidobacterium simiarum]PJM75453.1 hypothetical protein CSQ87_05465 [Bifidobacterium simiarum]